MSFVAFLWIIANIFTFGLSHSSGAVVTYYNQSTICSDDFAMKVFVEYGVCICGTEVIPSESLFPHSFDSKCAIFRKGNARKKLRVEYFLTKDCEEKGHQETFMLFEKCYRNSHMNMSLEIIEKNDSCNSNEFNEISKPELKKNITELETNLRNKYFFVEIYNSDDCEGTLLFSALFSYSYLDFSTRPVKTFLNISKRFKHQKFSVCNKYVKYSGRNVSVYYRNVIIGNLGVETLIQLYLRIVEETFPTFFWYVDIVKLDQLIKYWIRYILFEFNVSEFFRILFVIIKCIFRAFQTFVNFGDYYVEMGLDAIVPHYVKIFVMLLIELYSFYMIYVMCCCCPNFPRYWLGECMHCCCGEVRIRTNYDVIDARREQKEIFNQQEEGPVEVEEVEGEGESEKKKKKSKRKKKILLTTESNLENEIIQKLHIEQEFDTYKSNTPNEVHNGIRQIVSIEPSTASNPQDFLVTSYRHYRRLVRDVEHKIHLLRKLPRPFRSKYERMSIHKFEGNINSVNKLLFRAHDYPLKFFGICLLDKIRKLYILLYDKFVYQIVQLEDDEEKEKKMKKSVAIFEGKIRLSFNNYGHYLLSKREYDKETRDRLWSLGRENEVRFLHGLKTFPKIIVINQRSFLMCFYKEGFIFHVKDASGENDKKMSWITEQIFSARKIRRRIKNVKVSETSKFLIVHDLNLKENTLVASRHIIQKIPLKDKNAKITILWKSRRNEQISQFVLYRTHRSRTQHDHYGSKNERIAIFMTSGSIILMNTKGAIISKFRFDMKMRMFLPQFTIGRKLESNRERVFEIHDCVHLDILGKDTFIVLVGYKRTEEERKTEYYAHFMEYNFFLVDLNKKMVKQKPLLQMPSEHRISITHNRNGRFLISDPEKVFVCTFRGLNGEMVKDNLFGGEEEIHVLDEKERVDFLFYDCIVNDVLWDFSFLICIQRIPMRVPVIFLGLD